MQVNGVMFEGGNATAHKELCHCDFDVVVAATDVPGRKLLFL